MDQPSEKASALMIDGDADDNVETDDDVHITGDVCEGVRVRSGGSVQVGGDVKGGVTALEGVKVDGAVFNSQVRSGARLVMGSLVGGEVYGVDGVEVLGEVKGMDGAGAVVGIGADLALSARMVKVREGLDFCENDIGRILRTLGLQTVNKAQIQAVFQNTPSHKRKFVIGILKQLNQLVQVREELLQKQGVYLTEESEKLEKAEIRFVEGVSEGTRICFGDEEMTVDRDLGAATFHLRDREIQYELGK